MRPSLLLVALAGCAHASVRGQVAQGTPDEVNIVLARERSANPGFTWHAWSKETFALAKAEHRLLLVDGAAEWCHWCHVMDETTYRDPEVARLITERFIAVRVDIDERPDLAERYGDWGWPATILLSPDAEELGKFRGYIPAEKLTEILSTLDPRKLADAPAPAPGRPIEELPAAVKHARERLEFFWDAEEGGWGLRRKVPIGLNVVWELTHGETKRGLFTLQKQRALIDPVWGGIYQYSAAEDWNQPHFEKLLSYQAPNLEAFALGYAASHDQRMLDDARLIYRYLLDFLCAPDGTFYVNQDADLNAHDRRRPFVDGHVFYAADEPKRRAMGIPWVDTHVYARENGLAISALLAFWESGQEPAALKAAVRAAEVLAHSHVLSDGSVKHEAASTGPYFLPDAAALGVAFARLGAATRDPKWTALAHSVAARMIAQFGGGSPGALFDQTIDPDAQGVFLRRLSSFAPNVTAATLLTEVGDKAGARAILAAIGSDARIDAEMAWVGEFLLAAEAP